MPNKEKSFYQRLTEQYPSLGTINRAQWLRKSGLYCIHNLDTDRFYVGSAKSLYGRMTVHTCQLRKGSHHSIFLQRDYNLGRNNLEFHVLKVVPIEQLIQEEQQLLDFVCGKPGCYNHNPTASSWLGAHHSTKTKKKLSEMKKGFKHTQETKNKMRESHAGIPLPLDHPIRQGHSEEAKEKIRIATTGSNNPFYGRVHMDETKKKIAVALRGRYYGHRVEVMAINKETGEERWFPSMSAADRALNVGQGYISMLCAGLCKDTKAWTFRQIVRINYHATE